MRKKSPYKHIFPDAKAKIIFCGSEEAGKEELTKQINKNFPADLKSTLGINIFRHCVKMPDGFTILCQIWDLGSQEKFQGQRNLHYDGSQGALYVLNSSRKKAWDEAKNWINQWKDLRMSKPFILVDCSLDELHEDDFLHVYNYTKLEGGFYMSFISDNTNFLNNALGKLISMILERVPD